MPYDAARALLEPHRKVAVCKRAAGDSTESMVNFDAAVGIVAALLRQASSDSGSAS